MPSTKEIVYITPPQPRQIRLDSTTRCNAQCLSCHRHLTERKGEMDESLVVKILDDVSRGAKPLE